MNKVIRYADVWSLLRKLGFDCDLFDDNNHRVCEYAPTDTRIVLHDYPPTTPVHPAILIGLRLQLDNGNVMARDDFNEWAARRTKSLNAAGRNGAKPKRIAKKRAAEPPANKAVK
jgi:hypothetical protein